MSTKSEVDSSLLQKVLALGVPLLVTVVAVSLFLISHFLLGSWAEVSEFHHTIQHALIFMAGCGVGGSLISIPKIKD